MNGGQDRENGDIQTINNSLGYLQVLLEVLEVSVETSRGCGRQPAQPRAPDDRVRLYLLFSFSDRANLPVYYQCQEFIRESLINFRGTYVSEWVDPSWSDTTGGSGYDNFFAEPEGV